MWSGSREQSGHELAPVPAPAPCARLSRAVPCALRCRGGARVLLAADAAWWAAGTGCRFVLDRQRLLSALRGPGRAGALVGYPGFPAGTGLPAARWGKPRGAGQHSGRLPWCGSRGGSFWESPRGYWGPPRCGRPTQGSHTHQPVRPLQRAVWRLRPCACGSVAAGGTALHCRRMAWPSCSCSRCWTVRGAWAPVFGLPARGWFLMSADALPPPTVLGEHPSAKKNKCWDGDRNVCGLWRERRPAYGSRSRPVGLHGALRTDDTGPSSGTCSPVTGWKLRCVELACLLFCTWVWDVG